MSESHETVRSLLDRVSAKTPTPGGGTVAPIVGALASALARMVVEYSRGRADLKPHEHTLDEALGELARAQAMLVELADEDAAAYDALRTAMKMSKDQPDRSARIEGMARACAQPPLATIATCSCVLAALEGLCGKINPHLRSDMAIAAVLTDAAARASRWTVAANAPLAGASGGDLLRQADGLLRPLAERLRVIEKACHPDDAALETPASA